MTVSELTQRMRTIADEYGVEELQDTDAGDVTKPLGCYQLLRDAYNEFARRTLAFEEVLKADSVAGRAVYGFRAFGVEAADIDSISVSAPANNDSDFILIAGQPSGDQMEGHLVSVTFVNNKLGVADFTAVTVTVEGTDDEGASITFELDFDAQAAAPSGWMTTQTTWRRFATVTAISPSVAQTGGAGEWMHCAGVGAQVAGSRIIDPMEVYYKQNPLQYALRGQLATVNPMWRSQASGTPLWWRREGARRLRVYPGTSAAGQELMVAAYVTPEVSGWCADFEPDLHESHAGLLAVRGVLDFIMRSPTETNKERAAPLAAIWDAGTAAARTEFQAVAKADIVQGRFSDRAPRYRYPITIEGV